jgi:hypothetical protein
LTVPTEYSVFLAPATRRRRSQGFLILANNEWHFVYAHKSSGSTPGSQIARNKANQMVRLVV